MSKTVRKTKKMTSDWSNIIAHDGCEYDLMKCGNEWNLFASFNMTFVKSFGSKKSAYKHLSQLS